MRVSVVITCWNGRKLLEKNLPSVIKAKNNPKNKISEILVVDDGSTDDSVSFLQNKYSENVTVIEQQKNYGYARTCNTGVKRATGDLVVILNLDVIPKNDFLEQSIPHFDNQKVFAVSFNEEKFGPGKLVWENGFLEIKSSVLNNKTSLTAWCSGGSSIFRKSYWEKVGGMDELYLPFYFEDIDLCLRAYKSGYECYWEPKSIVSHEHEATINVDNFRKRYLDSIKQRNHLLLTWRNIDNFKMCMSNIKSLITRSIKTPGYTRIIFNAVFRLLMVRKIYFHHDNRKTIESVLKLLNEDQSENN